MNIPVVFSTDHNFVMPTGVAIHSLLRHSKQRNYSIFVLEADNVTEEDRQMLQSAVSPSNSTLTFIPMGNTFQGTFEIRGITYPTYYRLLIPWLLPQFDKVLYLDGDIVVKSDISEMYDINLEENYLAAFKPYSYMVDACKDYAPTLGLDYKNYVNAGVLLINAELMRKDNLKDLFLDHSKKKYTFVDQDILNIVCRGRIMDLNVKYNYPPHSDALWKPDEVIEPCIIHYAGPKPWNVFTYCWSDWYEAYKKSPFFTKELESSVYNNTWNRNYKLRGVIGVVLKYFAPSLHKFVKNMK